jgi:hypothetical protein
VRKRKRERERGASPLALCLRYIKGVLSSPAVMNHLSELITSGAIVSVPVVLEAKKAEEKEKGKPAGKKTEGEKSVVTPAALPVTTAPPKPAASSVSASSSSASITPITPTNSASNTSKKRDSPQIGGDSPRQREIERVGRERETD